VLAKQRQSGSSAAGVLAFDVTATHLCNNVTLHITVIVLAGPHKAATALERLQDASNNKLE
jgi:hypothetical protein